MREKKRKMEIGELREAREWRNNEREKKKDGSRRVKRSKVEEK